MWCPKTGRGRKGRDTRVGQVEGPNTVEVGTCSKTHRRTVLSGVPWGNLPLNPHLPDVGGTETVKEPEMSSVFVFGADLEEPMGPGRFVVVLFGLRDNRPAPPLRPPVLVRTPSLPCGITTVQPNTEVRGRGRKVHLLKDWSRTALLLKHGAMTLVKL